MNFSSYYCLKFVGNVSMPLIFAFLRILVVDCVGLHFSCLWANSIVLRSLHYILIVLWFSQTFSKFKLLNLVNNFFGLNLGRNYDANFKICFPTICYEDICTLRCYSEISSLILHLLNKRSLILYPWNKRSTIVAP